jgi:hypothetical protein
MQDELLEIFESKKALRKTDIKATERKMDTDVINAIDGDEIAFINNFLKKGEKIDNKMIKSIDVLLKKYKAKIGQGKIKSDGNILMLAPILSAMMAEVQK